MHRKAKHLIWVLQMVASGTITDCSSIMMNIIPVGRDPFVRSLYWNSQSIMINIIPVGREPFVRSLSLRLRGTCSILLKMEAIKALVNGNLNVTV